MPRILAATRDGLHSLGADGQRLAVAHAGRSVNAVVRDGRQLWAIVEQSEVWYAPAGRWRSMASLEGHKATCIAMTDAIHVGTSEARLFRLEGTALEPVAAFDAVEGRSAWYTPWGGPPDTRSISEWGDDVYVNVHVGGILHTDDRGATWNRTIDIDADVHQVATADGVVLAACAGGVATSSDRGTTWTMRSEGLEGPYSRAVVVSGDELLVSASDGPRGGRAAVYRGGLSHGRFERCTDGLPAWFDDNIDTYCLDSLNDGSFAAFGTADGRVFCSENRGRRWRELSVGLPAVQHVLVVPD
ncbi:MAG TPA: sialidase family protein [Actinomycetota bacterium]|nr:sialidase family protein [Actinomycetota bacterium]